MIDQDLSHALRASVAAAYRSATPLCIRGGNSKSFYGRAASGAPLDTAGHRGITAYEPTELVMTARAGTPLRELETTLEEHGQMLAFEPPHYGDSATLGGTIACNLSGPRRPWTGAARDFVLGTRIVNGKGEMLAFGGEVMKNVAGYDVSRLMTGALGTLGVLLEVSLKVLPKPETEMTLGLEVDADEAGRLLQEWARQPLPLSASCYDGATLRIRLSGTPGAVRAARQRIGGDPIADGEAFWLAVREQRRAFFSARQPLWRLSVDAAAGMLPLEGKWLYEWGGALRWLVSEAPAQQIRRAAAAAGGHATLYRGGDANGEVFQPLPESLRTIHSRLKQAFDPAAVLNRGRLYAEL